MTPIFPEPGHSYQLKPCITNVEGDPVIANIKRVNMNGVVEYTFRYVDDIEDGVQCHLYDLALMIDKEVEAPEGGE